MEAPTEVGAQSPAPKDPKDDAGPRDDTCENPSLTPHARVRRRLSLTARIWIFFFTTSFLTTHLGIVSTIIHILQTARAILIGIFVLVTLVNTPWLPSLVRDYIPTPTDIPAFPSLVLASVRTTFIGAVVCGIVVGAVGGTCTSVYYFVKSGFGRRPSQVGTLRILKCLGELVQKNAERAEGKARKLTAFSLIIAGIPIVVVSAGIFTQRWWLYQDEGNSDFIVENALRSINITSGGNFIASVLCSSWASWRARSRNLKESGQTEADSKEIQEKLVIVVGDDNVPGVEEVKTEDSLV